MFTAPSLVSHSLGRTSTLEEWDPEWTSIPVVKKILTFYSCELPPKKYPVFGSAAMHCSVIIQYNNMTISLCIIQIHYYTCNIHYTVYTLHYMAPSLTFRLRSLPPLPFYMIPISCPLLLYTTCVSGRRQDL